MFRKVLIILFAIPLLHGCGRDSQEVAVEPSLAPDVPEAALALGESTLFDRIDADTALIYANLRPMPDDVSEMIWAGVAGLYQGQAESFGEMADMASERSPLLAAIIRDLGGIRSAEDFEARGLASNGLWAVHMISVYPVAHMSLADGAAFDAWLQRLAEEAETEWPERMIDDQRLIWSDMGEFGLALHHDGQVATFGLIPDDDRLLRRIVNLDQPSQSFQPRDLQAFNQARGLTPFGSGYFELNRFFGTLLNEGDEQSAPLRSAMNMHRAAADAACDRELEALFTQVPRLSIGMPRLDRREISVLMRIETHIDLGKRLTPIADTPVGLDVANPRLLTGGLALNLIAARDFGREIVGGWVNTPPQCALFESVREGAADWQLALNRPIPPFITSIHGLKVDLSSLSMTGMGAGVEEASGTMALFMRNPQMLLGMAQMFSPELAALDLRPGGEPQRLPSALTDQVGDLPAWIAVGEQALGLALGEGQNQHLSASLEPGQRDDAILAYSLNLPAYVELMSRISEGAGEDGVDFDFSLLGMMLDNQEESRVSIHLREHGIDIISTSIFRQ